MTRFFSFFFQAEDGIRDWSVTGVQTCALPIFINQPRFQNGHLRFIYFPRSIDSRLFARLPGINGNDMPGVANANSQLRSEERRVGKECRYRWSTYDVRRKAIMNA